MVEMEAIEREDGSIGGIDKGHNPVHSQTHTSTNTKCQGQLCLYRGMSGTDKWRPV